MNGISNKSLLFDDDVSANSDVCQCCLSTKNLKNMYQTFLFFGHQEIYAEMLRSCFTIEVNSNETPDDRLYLICEKCIVKLREALSFKNQIENTQIMLKTKLVKCSENISDIKIEYEDNGLNDFPSDDSMINYELSLHSGDGVTNIKNHVSKKNKEKSKHAVKRKINTFVPENYPSIENVEDENQDIILDKNERRRHRERLKYAKRNNFKIDKSEVICQICNEIFPTNKKLIGHMSTHFPNHICDLCGKTFVQKNGLKTHLTSTHSVEKVQCDICNKSVKKNNMRNHLRTHTGGSFKHTCTFCGERFVSYSTRIKHMREVHNHNLSNRYQCKMCPRTFCMASELTRHFLNIHRQEKNHHCAICNKGFFRKNSLKEHMVRHTKERNFQCEVCHKSYGRRYTLVEHMKIHNNIKEFVCEICSRAFTQKCVLKGHMKTHCHENEQDLAIIVQLAE